MGLLVLLILIAVQSSISSEPIMETIMNSGLNEYFQALMEKAKTKISDKDENDINANFKIPESLSSAPKKVCSEFENNDRSLLPNSRVLQENMDPVSRSHLNKPEKNLSEILELIFGNPPQEHNLQNTLFNDSFPKQVFQYVSGLGKDKETPPLQLPLHDWFPQDSDLDESQLLNKLLLQLLVDNNGTPNPKIPPLSKWPTFNWDQLLPSSPPTTSSPPPTIANENQQQHPLTIDQNPNLNWVYQKPSRLPFVPGTSFNNKFNAIQLIPWLLGNSDKNSLNILPFLFSSYNQGQPFSNLPINNLYLPNSNENPKSILAKLFPSIFDKSPESNFFSTNFDRDQNKHFSNLPFSNLFSSNPDQEHKESKIIPNQIYPFPSGNSGNPFNIPTTNWFLPSAGYNQRPGQNIPSQLFPLFVGNSAKPTLSKNNWFLPKSGHPQQYSNSIPKQLLPLLFGNLDKTNDLPVSSITLPYPGLAQRRSKSVPNPENNVNEETSLSDWTPPKAVYRSNGEKNTNIPLNWFSDKASGQSLKSLSDDLYSARINNNEAEYDDVTDNAKNQSTSLYATYPNITFNNDFARKLVEIWRNGEQFYNDTGKVYALLWIPLSNPSNEQ